jgi:hypothetical protein
VTPPLLAGRGGRRLNFWPISAGAQTPLLAATEEVTRSVSRFACQKCCFDIAHNFHLCFSHCLQFVM